jgi:hypothetical protein
VRPAQKKSVSALDVPAAGLAGAHGRLDFGLFFAVSKEAVFPRMRIDAANTNARLCDSGTGQREPGIDRPHRHISARADPCTIAASVTGSRQ